MATSAISLHACGEWGVTVLMSEPRWKDVGFSEAAAEQVDFMRLSALWREGQGLRPDNGGFHQRPIDEDVVSPRWVRQNKARICPILRRSQDCFVSGHDFSRVDGVRTGAAALQAAEKRAKAAFVPAGDSLNSRGQPPEIAPPQIPDPARVDFLLFRGAQSPLTLSGSGSHAPRSGGVAPGY